LSRTLCYNKLTGSGQIQNANQLSTQMILFQACGLLKQSMNIDDIYPGQPFRDDSIHQLSCKQQVIEGVGYLQYLYVPH
jgi:hypothetical protein